MEIQAIPLLLIVVAWWQQQRNLTGKQSRRTYSRYHTNYHFWTSFKLCSVFLIVALAKQTYPQARSFSVWIRTFRLLYWSTNTEICLRPKSINSQSVMLRGFVKLLFYFLFVFLVCLFFLLLESQVKCLSREEIKRAGFFFHEMWAQNHYFLFPKDKRCNIITVGGGLLFKEEKE